VIVVDEQAALAQPDNDLALVRAVVQAHAPNHKFFAFGSRVVRTAADRERVKPHSDLDLAISGQPLPLDKMFLLRDAFVESVLPMRVDIVHTDDLPEGWEARAWPI